MQRSSVSEQLDILGGSWGCSHLGVVDHSKELRRYDVLVERLRRLKFLPSPLLVKAAALNVGCLSLLDYIPLPFSKRASSLRAQVRAFLAIQHGAPEIAFWIPSSSPLDPWARWLIAGIRLWLLVSKLDGGQGDCGKEEQQAFCGQERVQKNSSGLFQQRTYVQVPLRETLHFQGQDNSH